MRGPRHRGAQQHPGSLPRLQLSGYRLGYIHLLASQRVMGHIFRFYVMTATGQLLYLCVAKAVFFVAFVVLLNSTRPVTGNSLCTACMIHNVTQDVTPYLESHLAAASCKGCKIILLSPTGYLAATRISQPLQDSTSELDPYLGWTLDVR